MMGPTACGKTELAIHLNQILPIQIISVDSCLIYKGLDIGTSKPTPDQLHNYSHRLIDIVDPSNYYSVSNFLRDATLEIKNSILLKKTPLLIGGTMLYFHALLRGLDPSLPRSNLEIRKILRNFVKRFGLQKTLSIFRKIHPKLKISSNLNDFQRTLRAIEVFLISNKNIEDFNNYERLLYPVLKIAILPKNRIDLYCRIRDRFFKMLKSGLEEEVNLLYHRGDLNDSFPSIRSIGYRQMWSYLSGKISYESMIFESIKATKRFAKKQMTWIKNWKDLHLFDFNEQNKILEKVACFIDS
ncbi:tRNA (adenosine(37)-N6)-dimethylallyltransferase MiaA [Candidatus Riesia pediculicola]|nr:tRNA (adenosine(37)-N6)-dimethylallyltransferase MiaA [Candidatus Riesia pediculicola]